MILFIAFSAIHICFFIWLAGHWFRIIPFSGTIKKWLHFSVIIPIRNESTNIIWLLEDLEKQDYPLDAFEVIIIDDHSEDDSFERCQKFLMHSEIKGKVMSLKGPNGKKEALTEGISHAVNPVIITTDGDCRVGARWISAYNQAYQQSDAIMLTGPVRMEGNRLIERFQKYEFGILIGIGAASLKSGHPGMCNGANLSYLKEAFVEVDGYSGNRHIPSGDDEFLLQKLYNLGSDRIHFLKSTEAIVHTEAKHSFGKLLNQRKRWASKWKFHNSMFIRIMAILAFINYFLVIYAFVFCLIYSRYLPLLGLVLVMRWMSVHFFARPVLTFLGHRKLFFTSLIAEIIYPVFVTFLGLASIFGKYSWKGRRYK